MFFISSFYLNKTECMATSRRHSAFSPTHNRISLKIQNNFANIKNNSKIKYLENTVGDDPWEAIAQEENEEAKRKEAKAKHGQIK